jgi:hypothetical protein
MVAAALLPIRGTSGRRPNIPAVAPWCAALTVADLECSIALYSKLFGTGPARLRPGYANFAVTEPR